jgi:putative transposase
MTCLFDSMAPTPRRHCFSSTPLAGWLLLSPTGFVGAAISSSSLAAIGDLALLAATSQRHEAIQRTAMSKKKLETLSFELEQNRVLLSTLPVVEICCKGGFSDATFYKWRAKFGGMEASDAKRLKELESENAKLKKLLAEEHLDINALKSVFAVKR